MHNGCPVRVRIQVERSAPQPAVTDTLFADVFLPSHRSFLAPLGSVAIHVLLLVILSQAALFLTPVPDFSLSRYEIKPIDVMVPLYFAQMTTPSEASVKVSRERMQDSASPEGSSDAAKSIPPPRVELPPVKARKNAETVLLQPNMPMPNIQVSQMPALAFWARRDPTPAPPSVKPFVTPGRTEEPANAAPLDAPPVLAVPNRQTRLSDLNVAALPAARDAALPVQPSSTAPVRMPKVFQPPPDRPAGSIDAGQGDPANIIAFGAVPIPDKIVTVPPVSQAPSFGGEATPGGVSTPRVERPAPANPTPPGNDRAAGSNSRPGSGGKSGEPAKAGATETASSAAAATPKATIEPRKAQIRSSAESAGAAVAAQARFNSSVQQAAVLADATPRAPDPAAAAASKPGLGESSGTRFVQPRDGRFSFVVTGSSESYPEAKGLLAGKIIYTVSVRVGANRPWIMQYCLPTGVDHALGARSTSTPLEAPYPFVMIRPAIASDIDVRRLVIHGFVNLAGKFEQLSVVSDVEFPEKQALLASLAQWEFRPASRDGQATPVEVLLIIPREAV